MTHICVAECCFLLLRRSRASMSECDEEERLNQTPTHALNIMSSNSRVLDPYFDLHSLHEPNSNYELLRLRIHFQLLGVSYLSLVVTSCHLEVPMGSSSFDVAPAT